MAVHLGLVSVLAALVWRSAPPVAVMAELWSAVPQQAAPALVETEVAPPPPPPPEPSRRETAQAKEAALREADIALKKARDAEQRERRELEQRRKEKLEREKVERERVERERREKIEQDKARREKAERERQDRLDREKAERQKLDREKAERERRDKVERERTEKLRQENLARMQGLAGASGAPEASGTSAQSSGPSAGYAGRIRARIKPLIVYPDAGSGNPVAEVEVRLSPTGVIIGSRLLRRSGTPEWDTAVLRAVEKAEVLPKDVDGRVPAVMVLVFSPRE